MNKLVAKMIEAYVRVMGADKWNSMSAEEQHDAIMAMVKDTGKAIDRIEKEA